MSQSIYFHSLIAPLYCRPHCYVTQVDDSASIFLHSSTISCDYVSYLPVCFAFFVTPFHHLKESDHILGSEFSQKEGGPTLDTSPEPVWTGAAAADPLQRDNVTVRRARVLPCTKHCL